MTRGQNKLGLVCQTASGEVRFRTITRTRLHQLGQPRSPWAAITIHGGKGGRAAALAHEVRRLPDLVRSRLVLENDERAYGADEILAACKDAGVPMVFDAHHHVIHDRLDSYDDPTVAASLQAAAGTWPDPSWQLVHISNGRTRFHDMAHSDFISVMPACYRQAPWIEVEAKAKDEAISRLHAMGW
jgi:UV DNA damage endonuclease